MTFTDEQKKQLAGKLDPSVVSKRQQSGRSLSYIEGWHAIAEANRIFGFDAWDRETVEIRCVSERARKIGSSGKDGFGVSYVARVKVTVGDIVREGVGAGHGIDMDLGLAHESAIKEAETDAMKRAMMTFGNPFGLALYDKSQANVGRDEPEEPVQQERRSSASLKREDVWPEFQADLDGVTTPLQLTKVKDYWRAKVVADAWPKAWIAAMPDAFDAVERSLYIADDPDPVDAIQREFPGSRVVNETLANSPQRPL